ncbi:hypothetical protein PHSC3_001834 [Chlamydiales bacterium STE3]|nr:hypothetical protein PHSC3_001834 [Chlamydiales bacterium STE3]
MANITLGLLHGMVMETKVESFTGKYLYSDFATGKAEKDTTLNTLTKVPFIGIVAGIARVALGIIHTVGHLLGALFTFDKGHLFHASKGMCEILRGFIETLPIIGRIFANSCNSAPINDCGMGDRSWWMIKIYNPEKPDGLDQWMDNWSDFPKCFYIKS